MDAWETMLVGANAERMLEGTQDILEKLIPGIIFWYWFQDDYSKLITARGLDYEDSYNINC